MSNINWNINWGTWVSVCKAVGGFCASAGTLLGGITPTLAPLAHVVPALAPVAPVLAMSGIAIHGLATMAQSVGDMAAQNQADQAAGSKP